MQNVFNIMNTFGNFTKRIEFSTVFYCLNSGGECNSNIYSFNDVFYYNMDMRLMYCENCIRDKKFHSFSNRCCDYEYYGESNETCKIIGETGFNFETGWYHDAEAGRDLCTTHMNQLLDRQLDLSSFTFIQDSQNIFHTRIYSDDVFLKTSTNRYLFAQPIENLSLPIELTTSRFIRQILQTSNKFFKINLWNHISAANKCHDFNQWLLHHHKIGSIRSWLPFDHIVQKTNEEYWILVNCDHSSLNFKNILIHDGKKIITTPHNLETYLKFKNPLMFAQVSLPFIDDIVDIIETYLQEETKKYLMIP